MVHFRALFRSCLTVCGNILAQAKIAIAALTHLCNSPFHHPFSPCLPIIPTTTTTAATATAAAALQLNTPYYRCHHVVKLQHMHQTLHEFPGFHL
jgi:hypothetical protein